MKHYLPHISVLLLLILFSFCLPMSAQAEDSPSEEISNISVSVSFTDLSARQKILPDLSFACPENTTPEQLLEQLVNYAYLSDYTVEQDILTDIKLEDHTNTISYGSDGVWSLKINGRLSDTLLNPLADGDSLSWEYLSTNTSSIEAQEPSRSYSLLTSPETLWDDSYDSALSSTIGWLKESHTTFSAFFSLGAAGVSVEYRDLQNMMTSVSSAEYQSAATLAEDILSVSFCGIHASSVKGTDLIAKLSEFPNISEGGSLSAMLSLIAVDSNDYPLPSDGINTRQTLQQNILTSQNTDGGFSASKGNESTIFHTALAITALSPYYSDETIALALQNALRYLSNMQNYDGSFPGTTEYPTALSTAAVIVALFASGAQADPDDFIKGHNPIEALLSFQNQNGGFSPEIGEPADEKTTIAGLLAMCAAKGRRNICVLRTPILLNTAVVSQSSETDASEISDTEVSAVSANSPSFHWMTIIPLLFSILAVLAVLEILFLYRKRYRKKKSSTKSKP